MTESLLHDRENSDDTESFLQQNGKKFQQGCITAMKLMYQGIRLNGETCKQLYGFHDRRLRNCIAGRPDIVRRDWKRNEKGERLYMEYWIEKIKPPTKSEVFEHWNQQGKLL